MWLNWIPCRLIWWTSRIWLMLPDFLDLLILIFPTVISKHSEENPLCSLIWLIVLHICLDKGKFPKEAFLVDSRNSSDLFIYVKKSSLYLCLTCLTCTVYSVQCIACTLWHATRWSTMNIRTQTKKENNNNHQLIIRIYLLIIFIQMMVIIDCLSYPSLLFMQM